MNIIIVMFIGNNCDPLNVNKKRSLYTAIGENRMYDDNNYPNGNAERIVSSALMGSYSSNGFIALFIMSSLIGILMLVMYYRKRIAILETAIARVQYTNPMPLNRGK